MANRYVSFGYEITDGKYAVVEQEKGIVESIFGLYINGKSFAEISGRMNEAGTPYNNDGRNWNKNIVKRIIENRRYIGEKNFPQIIAKETFYAAEKIRLSKFTPPHKAEKELLDFYRKRLVCSECGSSLLRYKGSKDRNGRIYNYRRCSNRECIGNGKPVNEDKLNLMVAETINNLIDNYEMIESAAFNHSEQDIEVIRLENELADEMAKITVDIDDMVQKIIGLAEIRFQNAAACDYSAIDKNIKKELSIHPKLESADAKILNRIVKQIKYTPNKSIEIELINGYKIMGGGQV